MSKNLIHISYQVKAHHAKKYAGSSNLNEFYPDDTIVVTLKLSKKTSKAFEQ